MGKRVKHNYSSLYSNHNYDALFYYFSITCHIFPVPLKPSWLIIPTQHLHFVPLPLDKAYHLTKV